MQDDLTRLVGLEGFEVKRVIEVGDQLDLEVELVARAAVCPRCGRGSREVKERPRVRVRDLPLAGRRTNLVWRKRRFLCEPCGRTYTERHPELPPRQRVSRRFRQRLLERVRGGGAHAEVASQEHTTRYQVARAFRDGAHDLARRERGPVRRLSLDEAHHRRGRELATVVSDLDGRRVVEVLDGRSRRRVERYLRSLPKAHRHAIEVVSIDPYEAYRQAIRTVLPEARIVADHFHLVRGANTALDSVRRERQRQAGRRRPKGTRRSGQQGRWRKDLYRARQPAVERIGAALRARAAQALRTVRARAADRRSVGAKGELPRDLQSPRPSAGSSASSPRPTTHSFQPSTPSPTGSASGRRSYSPTSMSQPPTATPKASSTRSR